MVNLYQPVNFGGGMSGGMFGTTGSAGGAQVIPGAGVMEGIVKIAEALQKRGQTAAMQANIQEAIKAGQGWANPDPVMEGDQVIAPAGTRMGGGIEAIASVLAKNPHNAPVGMKLLAEHAMEQARAKPMADPERMRLARGAGLTPGTKEWQDFLLSREPKTPTPTTYIDDQGFERTGFFDAATSRMVPLGGQKRDPSREPKTPTPTTYIDDQGRERTGYFDPNTLRMVPLGGQKERRDPDKEAKITRLMETGMDRNTAIGIADGRLVTSRDPINGNAQIIDKATGKIIGNAPPAAMVQETPSTSMKPDVNYAQGTGSSGFFGWGANTLTDFLAGKLAAPETETAIQGLTNLQVRTQTAMQAGVPGRPSNYLMERLDRLAVAPGSLFQGDRRAHERLQQTRDMIREEIFRIDKDILEKSEGFRPQQIAEARANRSQLNRLADNYDVVVKSFERTLKGGNSTDPAVHQMSDDDLKRQLGIE